LLPLLLISLSLLASIPLLADVAVCLPQRCRQLCRYTPVLLVLLLVSLLLLESLLLASPVGFPALLLLVFLSPSVVFRHLCHLIDGYLAIARVIAVVVVPSNFYDLDVAVVFKVIPITNIM
jgi:hypothetical protein